MTEHFIIKEGNKRFFKLTTPLIVLFVITCVIGVTTMFTVIMRGSQWLYQNYQSQEQNWLSWNPFSKFGAFLATTNKPSIVEQPIRVVSEESQVVDVVKQTSPAVVSIIASAEVPQYEQCYQQHTPQIENLPPEFRNLFNTPNLCQNGTTLQQVGAGSGFIVSSDGYIVTNKHVVTDEKGEYTVILNDSKNLGKKLTAKVLARDPNNDVAILKVDAQNLPYLEFGDSDKLQVGQTSIAIGYALGEFDNTVSKGVVSGLARSIVATDGPGKPEELRGLIQSDAAINPGNSGGPLLDICGKIIGVNVAMAQAQSIGFAIPGNVARNAYEQVRETGKITAPEKAFIGVRYTPITSALKQKNKLPFDYGMLVARGNTAQDSAVLPGSPADKAGIVENDVILEADGRELNERYSLADVVAVKKPGDEITLKVYHQGQTKEVKIKLDKTN